MPTAIPFIIAAATATTTAVVVANLILAVGSLALSNYQKRKAKSAKRAAFDAAQVDRFANVPAQMAPRELVLGRMVKGGTVFFRTSVGAYNEKFLMCMAVAGHEIDGIEAVLFNGVTLQLGAGGEVQTGPWARFETTSYPRNPLAPVRLSAAVTVLPAPPNPGSLTVVAVSNQSGENASSSETPVAYTLDGSTLTIAYDPQQMYYVSFQSTVLVSKARVRWHLGAPGQAADAGLIADLPGVWTAQHRVAGVAYVICEFDYDETAYPSGLPSVAVRLRGAKAFDPRTGLTQFTENPAIMLRHVAMHPQFGKRTAMTAAEDARITAAANASDQAISYSGSDLVQTFRAAYVVPFGSPARDIFDDLAQAMGGEWAYAAGELHVRAGVYQMPVASITDADLAVVQRTNDGGVSQSAITVSTHRARNEKFNIVLPRIWDQAAGYVQSPIAPFRADALVADDGAELAEEVTMPAVFYAGQAFHIAGIMLRDSRDPMTVVLPLKLRCYPLELFDTVAVTLARYGWVAKEFRILGRNFAPDGSIQVTLKETTAAIYQYGAGFVAGGYASNSGLPRPWDIQPPTIIDISSGESELIVQSDGTIVNGVRVMWAPIADVSVLSGGFVDVEWISPSTAARGSITVSGSATSAVIPGLQDGAVVVIRARSRNDVATSDWSLQISHQVIGKTEPPPDIENLSISGSVLSWSLPRRVPDLAGFIFRFHYGSNTDWGSAAPLHDGIVTESPWQPATRPGGVVTIMGKAIDTTGNVSKNAAVIVMNLGDAPIANIIEFWDFEAMGWPFAAGEQSGWTLVSGDPSANALDSLYGTDDQSFYGADNDSFYDAGAYGQMIFVTPEISVNSALQGSIMTLEAQTQGTDVRIDYRLSGPGSFYDGDNDSFYGPDADPIYGAPAAWQPWPGQLIAANDVYQFRVTIGAGVDRGILEGLVVTIDAPDIEEEIDDLPIAAGGTVIPYSMPFTAIKTVIGQLQANGSGAVTIEVDKTNPIAPVVRAFNSAHTSVSGASADFRIKGY